MNEWNFERSGIARRLTFYRINDIYVSGVNHAFDPVQYLQAMPKSGAAVSPANRRRWGPRSTRTTTPSWLRCGTCTHKPSLTRQVPTMIEQDDKYSALSRLVDEDCGARHCRAGTGKPAMRAG